MISILILEDKIEKAKSIAQSIQNTLTSLSLTISHVSDIISGKKELIKQTFDLLLLDLQIPTRFDKEPNNEGGIIFLKEIFSDQNIKLPSEIIAYSSDPTLIETHSFFFRDNAIISLHFSENSDLFLRSVLNKIRYIFDSSKRAQNQQRNYFYDLALICAVESTEHDAILRLPANWEPLHLSHDPSTYYTGNFKSSTNKPIRVVSVCCTQMGMVPAAIAAIKLISFFSPKLFIMTGICAGCGDASLGDLIIANPSWDYDSGKIIDNADGQKFLPDPRQISIDPFLLSRLQALTTNNAFFDHIKQKWPSDKPKSTPKLIIGPVSSGAAVISSSERVKSIQEYNRKMVGLDMETYGFYFACQNSNKPPPKFFSVKAVSDFADKKKKDDFQKYAAFLSSQFVFEAVSELF